MKFNINKIFKCGYISVCQGKFSHMRVKPTVNYAMPVKKLVALICVKADFKLIASSMSCSNSISVLTHLQNCNSIFHGANPLKT
jgi:hypothetical protein